MFFPETTPIFILLKSFCFKIMLILLMNDFSSSVMASN